MTATMLFKIWHFLRTYVLTLHRFDLCCQGALLILVVLQTNCLILLRRDAGTGSLPALIEDWAQVGSGVVECLLGVALAWFGRGRRQFAVSGWLAATAVTSLLVLAFPYQEATPRDVGLCDGGIVPLEYSTALASESQDIVRVVFLVIATGMCSLSMISIWALGLTYLDDHDPKNGPYYYGILISIRLSLGLNSPGWLRPGAVTDDWWIAHLTLSLLILTFAIFFLLFPTKMPQWKPIQSTESTDFMASVTRVVKNKAVMIQGVGCAFIHAAFFCYMKYDAAYVQARYHVESVRQDPRTSRAVTDIMRSMIVIFFVMIFRMRFSVRRSDGVKSNTASKVGGGVAVAVTILFAVIALLSCDVMALAGMEDGDLQTPACSSDCGCESGLYGYTPVCGLDTSTTYFSPCNAGCGSYEDLNGFFVFSNCTCGEERAVRGSCSISDCSTPYSFYLIFFNAVTAVTGAAIMMQGMVPLRAVARQDKPVAMAVSMSLIALLAHVGGNLLYLLISHANCAYYGIDGAACQFHKASLWWLPATSALLALLSATISIFASRYRAEEKLEHS